MKLTISCIEGGGFSGEYALPGFGCILRVNADGNIVTIEVVDEEEDRIQREIAEERKELSKETVEEDLGDFLEEAMLEETVEEEKERPEEFQEYVMEHPWDITGIYDYEDLFNEKGEYLLADYWKGTQWEKEVEGLKTSHIENHEDEDKDDDIENTFEYEFVKSVQETDESGVVLKFLEQLLNDLDVNKTDVNGNTGLMNLLKGLSDYISELDVKK